MGPIVALLTATTLVATASDTWAHGSAPAILDVVSSDADASRIRLTVGLAERVDEGWRWICPASWGGPETPVVADHQGSMVVFGDEGMVRVSGGAGTFVEGGAELDAASVRAAVASEDSLFILARLDGEDLLLASTDGPPTIVAQLRGTWQSLDVRDGSPFLGAVRDGSLLVAEVRPQGTGVSEVAYPLDLLGPARASLRLRGERTFAVISTEEDFRLFELDGSDATEIFASSSAIHGPMPIGESLFAVSDGALWELGENTRVVDNRVRYTCAVWSPDASFVCAQTALFQAFDGGAATVPTFQHADLRPPLAASGSCQGEWLDYAGHAGIDLTEQPANEPETGDEASGPTPKTGCSSTRQHPQWPMIVLAALCLTRRPRQAVHPK